MHKRRVDLLLSGDDILGDVVVAERAHRRRADILTAPEADAFLTVLLTGQPRVADNGVYEVSLDDRGEVQLARPSPLAPETLPWWRGAMLPWLLKRVAARDREHWTEVDERGRRRMT